MKDFLKILDMEECSHQDVETILEVPKVWVKLEQGWIKINMDVDFKGGKSDFAMVV